VTEYQIYLDGVAHGSRVSLNNATVSGLNANSTCAITVSAFDAAGNESDQSDPVTISTEVVNLVPGATILAFSEDEAGTEVENLFDGINHTDNNRWSAKFFPQSVEIDLGQAYCLTELRLYTYKARDYQYQLYAKVEGGSYEVVVDRSNNTEPGNPITDSLEGVTAQYLKLVVTGADDYGGDWVSIREMEVDGVVGVTESSGGSGGSSPTYDTIEDVIIGNDIESYTNQDKNGDTIIAPDNSAVTMTGNNWKRLPLNPAYVVTPNTVLEVTINAQDTGEITGFGFEDNATIDDALRVFQLGGSANWSDGILVSQPYAASDVGNDVTFTIHVGQYYTGSMDWLVFIADDDANSSCDITFGNIAICEIAN